MAAVWRMEEGKQGNDGNRLELSNQSRGDVRAAGNRMATWRWGVVVGYWVCFESRANRTC